MSTLNQKTISKAIEQAMSYIPAVWPLQQLIATNPLWSLIHHPIEAVTENLKNIGKIQSTLKLSEYWQYYQQGVITDSAIHQSIKEFSDHHFRNKPIEAAEKNLFQQLLYGFMTNQDYTMQLIFNDEKKPINSESSSKILFSYQAREYAYDSPFESVNSVCLDWLSNYFNPSKFQKKLTSDLVNEHTTEDNIHFFYNFWHTLLSHKNARWKEFLKSYPTNQAIEITIAELLAELFVPSESIPQYILEISWQLKGWMGYLKWQQNYPNNPYIHRHAKPCEIIALWLALEVFWFKQHRKLLNDFKPTYEIIENNNETNQAQKTWFAYIDIMSKELSNNSADFMKTLSEQTIFTFHQFKWIWQNAYEISYRMPLYQSLMEQKHNNTEDIEKIVLPEKPSNLYQTLQTQWVFCIDVRSEGFRRHLEKTGNHETFGFAGFFGIAYQLNNQDKHKLTCQCPALIEPSLLVDMLKAPQSLCKNTSENLLKSLHSTRKSTLSPFALYEIIGLWFGFTLLFKNYANTLRKFLKKSCFSMGKKPHKSSLSESPQFSLNNISLETKTTLATNLLQGIGLTKDFKHFVIICGHTAMTENNPYQAALDCGACGGNSGTSNAIIACRILNEKAVRAQLSTHGIKIPSNTQFIPACHNTTTDEIHWYPEHDQLDIEQLHQLNQIQQDAIEAGKQLQKERLSTLPGDRSTKSRATHWAELIPEWGLANNASFIIAPRQFTKSLNLKRRTFLHSYRSEDDPDGSILESIMLGPMIVAHWINSQYYFSSVSPIHYGAGNKAIHNVLPNIGVMEGNQSDLKYGLPQQSVFYQHKRAHQPQRLFILIDAEPNKIDTIINKNPTLNSLVSGQWIFIKSLRSEQSSL